MLHAGIKAVAFRQNLTSFLAPYLLMLHKDRFSSSPSQKRLSVPLNPYIYSLRNTVAIEDVKAIKWAERLLLIWI